MSELVQRTMFDEAIRTGEKSATMAARHMNISRVAVDAIHTALELLKVGRTGDARDRLDRALVAITRMSKP
jgi:hypothetical protein